MGLPPWETSDDQLFALVTGANSGLGFAIASRLIDEFFTSPSTTPNRHLILILCTRSPMKTRYTISRLRAHLRILVDHSQWAKQQRAKAAEQGGEYRWEETVQRVHFLGVEVDLCDLRSVYRLADKLVNGTVGSPDATLMDGGKLPHGSPGTASYDPDMKQDRWALSQEPGSIGAQRSWGWGLSGLRIPRLDAVILSAGIGGWVGLNWPLAVRTVMFDTVEAVTWPRYKVSSLGSLVKNPTGVKDEASQPLLENQEKPDEPPLGEVFCANVFGHYILAHELMPLLSRTATPSSTTSGKIIWVSSIEAVDDKFSIDDIQGLESAAPYEASKRLMDLLALTSSLPSVQRLASSYFDSSNTTTAKKGTAEESGTLIQPQIYLTHPGIFASEIMPLPSLLVLIYKLVFLFARWIGSPWHLIEPYKAAVAPVWLSLTHVEELNDAEGNGLKKAKWGSATDTGGGERVMKTEVPGWGWNGDVEDTAEIQKRKGRKRDAVDLTKERREEFEVLGGKCWAQMEELRKEWEGILGVNDNK
ncbi:uncharacterized protein L3040_004351 [Drepanopeziza brunnea f. sp. 'multigermtubi']|uniref:uncharacterized protein n=1 Tax=Drepanopeziza brunnea f. sp. 'multigermtubi' TaxID=698441 RepID=UPI00238550F7|nr:hypothetical protein L3040_004351 [Drepanopeziza brunnea f. sp. 'multigermtubi']